MKLISAVLAAALMTSAAPAFAQSAFDGTWKVDTDSAAFKEKPFEFKLKDGMYHCGACTPPLDVKADGAFHKVAGHDGFDEVAITPNPDSTITEIYRKGGKVTSTGTDTLSADGNTITYTYVDTGAANGKEVKGTVTMERVGAPAPAGLHPINGLWKTGKVKDVSDEGLTIILKVVGNTVTESFLTGETVTATFGGPAAPVKGDLGGASIKATKGKDGSITLTRVSKAGKETSALTLKPQADGTTMQVTSVSKLTGDVSTFKASKQ